MQKKILLKTISILIIAATVALISNTFMVKPFDTNIFALDFVKEWETIEQNLERAEQDYVVEDFYIEFKKDGTLDSLEYQLIGGIPNNYMHYWVRVHPDSNEYIIEGRKVKEWLQYDRHLSAGEFFAALNALELEKLIPTEECVWYFIHSAAELSNYAVENQKKYLISNEHQLIEIKDKQLPIEGYYLTSGGFKEVSKNRLVCLDEVDYFFKVVPKAF